MTAERTRRYRGGTIVVDEATAQVVASFPFGRRKVGVMLACDGRQESIH
jgi:hypothetical protein